MFTTHHVSHVTCQLSRVACHRVICHLSQCGGASQRKVCYQRVLPPLVSSLFGIFSITRLVFGIVYSQTHRYTHIQSSTWDIENIWSRAVYLNTKQFQNWNRVSSFNLGHGKSVYFRLLLIYCNSKPNNFAYLKIYHGDDWQKKITLVLHNENYLTYLELCTSLLRVVFHSKDTVQIYIPKKRELLSQHGP